MGVNKLTSIMIAFLFVAGAFFVSVPAAEGECQSFGEANETVTKTITAEIPAGIGGTIIDSETDYKQTFVFENIPIGDAVIAVTYDDGKTQVLELHYEGEYQTVRFNPSDDYVFAGMSHAGKMCETAELSVGVKEDSLCLLFLPKVPISLSELSLEGSDVTLDSDYVFNGMVTIDHDVTINLGDHMIYSDKPGEHITFFNVNNCNVEIVGNGAFIGTIGNNPDVCTAATLFNVTNGGSVAINGGTYCNLLSDESGAVFRTNHVKTNDGEPSITFGNDYSIISCSGYLGNQCCGIVDIVDDYSFQMNGGEVRGCGTPFLTSSGASTFSSGRISGFSSAAIGDNDALIIQENGILRFNASQGLEPTVISNVCAFNIIGISNSVDDLSSLILSGVTIKNCFADGNLIKIAGNVRAQFAYCTITGCVSRGQSGFDATVYATEENDYVPSIHISTCTINGNAAKHSFYAPNVFVSDTPMIKGSICCTNELHLVNELWNTVEIESEGSIREKFAICDNYVSGANNLVNTKHNMCGSVNGTDVVWIPGISVRAFVSEEYGYFINGKDEVMIPNENGDKEVTVNAGSPLTADDEIIDLAFFPGYEFGYWALDAEGTVKADASFVIKESIELYAFPASGPGPDPPTPGGHGHSSDSMFPILAGFAIVALLAIAVCAKYGNDKP